MPENTHPGDVNDSAGWLRDEPTIWHEVNRALQDVSILLQYLGELPDARLLGYFNDTRTKLADSGAARSVPPCDDYAMFLRRLFQIAAAFQTGRTELLPKGDAPQDAAGGCADVAFVYWSRDFLSAVASPATAELIRITHEFLVCKAWTFWRRRHPPRASEASIPPLPPDLCAAIRNRLASKLAWRVRLYEISTIAAVLGTVLISVYALSGRLVLNNEQMMQDAWSKIDAQIEAEESKIFEPVHMPITADARQHFDVTGLCELTRTVPTDPKFSRVAANGNNWTSGSSGAEGGAVMRTLYATPHQAHLCTDRAKALLNLFIVTVHLQSWSSVITKSFGSVFAYPFGVVPATLRSFAEQDRGCFELRQPEHEIKTAGVSCERILWAEIDRSRHVADSILGAVTQYILPVLYGFLGAMAASMRLLRRKVDAFLLSYTDRARLQQGAILGVLCGAVIGLFATFLSGMGGSGSVGTAALALLAGYNVDGVFRFLDELSDRLFRPASPAKPS